MKRILLSLTMLVLVGIAYAQNPKLEEKRGYQKIILGEPMETISEKRWPISKPNGESENVEWYKYASSKARRIGNVKLKRITVKAFKNKIMEIVLHFRPVDRSDIKVTLSAAYGEPDDDKWESENIALTLTDNRAVLKYKPLIDAYNKERVNIAKEAAENL